MEGISSAGASALSSSRAPVSDRVEMAVLNKVQDQQKADGEAAVRLIDSARLAKEPGKGRMIDVTA